MNATATARPTAVEARNALLTAGGGIVAVHDHDGVLARLSPDALTDPAGGLVAFRVRPGTRRPGWLPADLHTALGADQGLTGWGRPGEGDWALAVTAALAQRLGHIIVLDAWLLTPALLRDLLTNLQATAAGLWLVGRGALSDDQRDALSDWVADLTDPQLFLDAWADRPNLIDDPGARTVRAAAAPTPAALRHEWPHHLPDDDFTTFRATCRDRLTPAQFAAVDEHFVSTARTARAWFAANLTRVTLTDEQNVAARLHQVWQDSPTIPHFATALRAHQVAAFSLGWFLKVDRDQLLGTAAVSPRRTARTPAVWARLGGYASPYRGAVCALVGAGLDIADFDDVLVESVTDAGRTVILPSGRRLHVEDGAHRLVHAQKLARQLHGAQGDDPLVADEDGRPLRDRAIANIISTARLELGINLTGLRTERRTPTGNHWYTRWGVSMQELT